MQIAEIYRDILCVNLILFVELFGVLAVFDNPYLEYCLLTSILLQTTQRYKPVFKTYSIRMLVKLMDKLFD